MTASTIRGLFSKFQTLQLYFKKGINQMEQHPNIKSRVVKLLDTHYYLSGQITSPEDYVDLVHLLHDASAEDNITIHINSVGGCVETAIQIIGAMRVCKGNVTTIIEGEACSSASIIFLCGHSMIVSPHSYMMVHTISAAIPMSKQQEINSWVNFNKARFMRVLEDVYDGFLSSEEMKQVENGMDLYFGEDEILARLKRMFPDDDK